ncbi:DUF4288 domain-containing protein [Streptomyces sp. ISL-11]|uniref:DUF4288 domain-containing protein n=1 Tax=Streptomyces sp. ISL-11 TaxID=2819174 RepID=UPI001BE56673|nr:DUF4288 domain-containing protein [Streptomyces sp. ISL-11]MBT2384609.1 DUF4288 domain-containing protein [Streptomyces sp. ISL-11]
MSKYTAVLLCETSADAADHVPLFQESFVLIEAENAARARWKAAAHGRRLETAYENERGELITWKLRHVVDVNEVLDENLVDGAELYARHFRDYAAYRSFEPLLSGEGL